MEKIILVQTAGNLNMNAIDFACYIAKLTHSRLTGVFLEGIDEVYSDRINSTAFADRRMRGKAEKDQEAQESVRQFREACICRDTLTTVHRDRGVPLTEVISESRFSDLIIVDAETSFSRSDRSIPGRFVKDVLEGAECPVLIAPYSFEDVDEIIFTYNGTASSLFAIKQFTYLFTELTRKKVVIVNVQHEKDSAMDEQFKLKEWVRTHYMNAEYVVLKGDAADQLFGFLIERKRSLVIMGAYGRSMLSRFFKPSQARLIVKTINLPIFIAHH